MNKSSAFSAHTHTQVLLSSSANNLQPPEIKGPKMSCDNPSVTFGFKD